MPSFSLRNPHTIIVAALIITILGVNAFARMPVDVFPNLKIPAVVVATFYPGMPPLEMEGDITTRFERFFTLGSEIEHIESRSLPGVSIIKVFFHPGIDLERGGGAVGRPGDGRSAASAARHAAAAGAAVGRLVAAGGAGDGLGQGLQRDPACATRRSTTSATSLATVAGASVPPPFGGKFRQIMVYVDRDALQARGLTPMDVVHALNRRQPDHSGGRRQDRRDRTTSSIPTA